MSYSLHVRSDKPITESDVYKASLTTQLLISLCDKDTNLNVPLNQEIFPNKPRHRNDQDHTRLIVVHSELNHKTKTETITEVCAIDDERLQSTIDIDKFLKITMEVYDPVGAQRFDNEAISAGLSNVFAVNMFRFFEEAENITAGTKVHDVAAVALAATIAIGFNDPLDVLIRVTRVISEDPSVEPKNFCYIEAVKPRPKH